ncbi:STAS-like domain-containing protein [Gryllotalpicola protaetiae]|uniref:MerR family DNA-binding transcriptional regulator n=1 Tax=Gryllotalpicola protaetiae TaxID=2419771 RepID=A0A387BP97_9MICO|nr:DUF4325 domain-containing protein [Gryllotalpicola protaetiae]AYG02949.1 MerR family DNA-binding transcriptional regulator [Gryllotalpicola protaetiae]
MAAIRIGELSAGLGLPIKTLRRLADAGAIPSHRTEGGHRLFDPDAVRAALGRSATAETPPAASPDWRRAEKLDGLREDVVWAAVASELGIDPKTEGGRIAAYAFTEMLNNAIDHSGGTSADIQVWRSSDAIDFTIADDGEGIFAHVRDGLGLATELDAAAELTKGKRTTMSERHSGEGIFFTSKAVDTLRIAANGLRLTFDNTRGDFALGVDTSTAVGTAVTATVSATPTRTLRQVFDQYTDEDGAFARSTPTVKLFGAGVSFVSRSEARRLLDGMDVFREIDLDFAGVEDVGQGFIDEVLRVWPSQHPEVRVTPMNMNEAVEFMARRVARPPVT